MENTSDNEQMMEHSFDKDSRVKIVEVQFTLSNEERIAFPKKGKDYETPTNEIPTDDNVS